MEVEYRDVPGYKGFEASSEGKVFTSWLQEHREGIRGTQRVLIPGHRRELKGTPDPDGYLKVSARKDLASTSHSIAVHTLVCLAFHGPKPAGDYTVNHKDWVKTNNCPDNLEWMERSENSKHRTEEQWKAFRDASASSATIHAEDAVLLACREYVVTDDSWAHIGQRHKISGDALRAVYSGNCRPQVRQKLLEEFPDLDQRHKAKVERLQFKVRSAAGKSHLLKFDHNKGAYYVEKYDRWYAMGSQGHKSIYIGSYPDRESALTARRHWIATGEKIKSPRAKRRTRRGK